MSIYESITAKIAKFFGMDKATAHEVDARIDEELNKQAGKEPAPSPSPKPEPQPAPEASEGPKVDEIEEQMKALREQNAALKAQFEALQNQAAAMAASYEQAPADPPSDDRRDAYLCSTTKRALGLA